MTKLCPRGKAAAKRRRIKAGSGEKMRKKGSKGSPTAANFARARQTARTR